MNSYKKSPEIQELNSKQKAGWRERGIITLNGQKCAGKSTIAMKLEELGYGSAVNMFRLRDFLQHSLFDKIKSTPAAGEVLLSFATDFRWRILPYLELKKLALILDHGFIDFWIQIAGCKIKLSELEELLGHLYLPKIRTADNFYLDIPYKLYLQRRRERKKQIPDIPDSSVISKAIYEQRRQTYIALCKNSYLTYIDATPDLDTVLQTVIKELETINND